MGILFALTHHLLAATVLVCAVASLALLQGRFDIQAARRLRHIDRVNAVAATLVLGVGLVRLLFFEKGAAYYFHNGPFLAKLALYGLASVLSLPPTLEIKRWRTALVHGSVPSVSSQKLSQLRWIAWAQTMCVAAMALCASWAARGGPL